MSSIITEPGIYKDLPNEVYHRSAGISNSGIGLLIPPNCPALYHYQYLSGEYERKENKAFDIGSAVHTLVLEPEKFDGQYACITDKPPVRRGAEGQKKYDEFMSQYEGKTVLSIEDFATAKAMADAVRKHAVFKEIHGTGCVEDSIAWIDPESGVLLRTRPDFYNSRFILDVKTTKDIRPHVFQRSVFEYGYHRQGALACDGLSAATGINYDKVILFVVGKDKPHFVRAYILTQQALERGRAEYKLGARCYAHCMKTGIWPGYAEIIEDIDLPVWAFNQEIDE